MSAEEEVGESGRPSKPDVGFHEGNASHSSSSHHPLPPTPGAKSAPEMSPKKPLSPGDFVLSIASNIASQPLHNSDPNVWGVLTAISTNARKRRQGINMLLNSDEHNIGRLVDDFRFRIESNQVSANHCKIYRKAVSGEDAAVFVKDTSTNGTYLNWDKLKKNSSEAKLCHGDIISLAAPPEYEHGFTFVYREVLASPCLTDGTVGKRKAEDFVSENKRLKGIGIGALEGPLSLDDFRSLQRSNKELRKQLEDHVITIDALRNEIRVSVENHENEMKRLKDSVSNSYQDQLNRLQQLIEGKQKELGEMNRISSEQKHAMEDLHVRLSASMQSCAEANEIMNSQNASIAELKAQLDEERDQRREEREKATSDLKAAVQKAQIEAQEEFKRLNDATCRREREQQEVISKLQESEKERCLLVESLRSKLEETRQKLVISDNKIRQLESQVCEEQQAFLSERKKVEELERGIRALRKELETEKAAREEAWAKVSMLELEINSAMRDLDSERRRLKGSREKIMLRETQLRTFYSSTEKILASFVEQQEQIKSMRRTLEDEENYENDSTDIDLNLPERVTDRHHLGGEKGASRNHNNNTSTMAGSAQRFNPNQAETSSNSVTEKHECNVRSQCQECQNTQEVEFSSGDHVGVKGAGFGSEIDGMGTAPILEGEIGCTERVFETESLGLDGEQNLAGASTNLDNEEEAHVCATEEQDKTIISESLPHSRWNNHRHDGRAMEDTEPGGTIITVDLLASEVVGSWACSTAPSVHGGNYGEDVGPNLHNTNGLVDLSQSTPSSEAVGRKQKSENQGPRETPILKEQFGGGREEGSDSDTVSCFDDDDNGVNLEIGRSSDSDTECSDEG